MSKSGIGNISSVERFVPQNVMNISSVLYKFKHKYELLFKYETTIDKILDRDEDENYIYFVSIRTKHEFNGRAMSSD